MAVIHPGRHCIEGSIELSIHGFKEFLEAVAGSTGRGRGGELFMQWNRSHSDATCIVGAHGGVGGWPKASH